jgi:hypothetical protein
MYVLLSWYIWQVNTRFLCLSYLVNSTLPGLLGFCSAPGHFRPGLSAYPFGFCDWKPIDSRLWPAKVPQPGVDLVNVTVPARSLAWSVSTAEFKGLLLSRSILVRNSRCGVSVKEARRDSERVAPVQGGPQFCQHWGKGQERVGTGKPVDTLWLKCNI